MKAGQTIQIDGRLGVIASVRDVTMNGRPSLLVDVHHRPSDPYHPFRVEYYLPPESEPENVKEVQEENQDQDQG